ncbi:MAG TPA: hypothetical protein VFG44_01645 [Burkholderiales bacterium]|jgi:hypothetical protein|nr:hypothetical protein [Burkholderiales bacterium]
MPTAARLSPVAIAFCAACATQPPSASSPPSQPASPASQPSSQRPPPPVNLSGYSPAFKQGYSDGCVSARGSAVRRDDARYRSDNDYMMGWSDGNSVCRSRR